MEVGVINRRAKIDFFLISNTIFVQIYLRNTNLA